MIKILDRFVLRSFIRPFIITFIVMVFFLLMQFVWKYIDDLVGRGVEWYYIAELLFYTSATVVPMALPLAVLLSSIMTYGTLGEHNEMTALKASGNSLMRIMYPLIVFLLFIAVAAFFFANYVIPVANLKSETLLRNITNKKPALNIREGVFYTGIDGYSIKIGKKYGPDKNLLHNVFIYDHTKKMGNIKVIVADRGSMKVAGGKKYLNITLYDGNSYEDLFSNKSKQRNSYSFVHSSFKEFLIRFNLSDFQSKDLHKDSRKDYDMLNVVQLNQAVDSLYKDFTLRKQEFSEQISSRYTFPTIKSKGKEDTVFHKMNDELLTNIEENNRQRIVQNALKIARSNRAYYTNAILEYDWRLKIIARHLLEWNKKFSISFSCLVLFFIGAPLGAIIRKGGMGMPVVVSLFIFIAYHVTSYSFEKLGRELVWTPFQAIWTTNFILLLIGSFLTYKSATDNALFDFELYLKSFQKIWNILCFRKGKID